MRFVVIGAHVLASLGRPRYTEDLDVLVEPSAANAQRLARAFEEFGYDELARATPEHFSQEERMATLGRAPIAIDVLTSTAGLTFEEAWAGRRVRRMVGHNIPFLGLAEYVKTKRACGRPKDLLDIELLREAGLLAAAHPAVRRSAGAKSATKGAARKPAKKKRK